MKYVDGRDETDKDDQLASQEYYEELSKKVKWYHKVLLNQPLKVAIVLFLVAVVSPILLYFFVFKELAVTNRDFSVGICAHPHDHRLQCGPDNITEKECEENCCYDGSRSFCYHLLPSRYSYVWTDNMKSLKPRNANAPYRSTKNLPKLEFYMKNISSTHLNFILYDPAKVQYEKWELDQRFMSFDYRIYNNEFFFEIYRKNETDKSRPIMTTARGPLVFAKNFIEWSFYLSDQYVYGMGELVLKSLESKMWYGSNESASAMPFVMAYRNGSFHGLYIEQESGMEVSVSESRVITVRSFSDKGMNVHFFQGKDMKDLHQQFVDYVGKSRMLPYRAMGIHFCRSTFPMLNSTEAIEQFEAFLTNATSVEDGIAFDSDCIDDDLFRYINYDNSSNGDILAMVEKLKLNAKSFLPSIRPHVLVNDKDGIYNATVIQDILIMDPVLNESFTGTLYNKTVVYPDYSMGKTTEWLKNSWLFSGFSDSFVLKDSWPENQKNLTNCTVTLPYIRDNFYDDLCKSIPWNARSPLSYETHVENHNTYGIEFSKAVENVTTSNKEAFIISTSGFPGNRAGYRPQNLKSSWDSMKRSIKEAVANSMAGSYFQGVPVCGDANSTSETNFEKLCVKWYLASITLPIYHVHSNWVQRHPYGFSGFARRAIRNAFEMRYRLLPYYYTILNKDGPLLRGMYYEFSDETSMELDDQFMVGDSIMVAPEFDSELSSVPVYFPNVSTWYDLWGGAQIIPSNESWLEIPTLESDIPMFLRGGFILPIQEGDGTKPTILERRLKMNYTLIIGLNCTSGVNSTCFSNGFLYIENSHYMIFKADEAGYNISIPNWKSAEPTICGGQKVSSSIIDEIRVYGKKNKVVSVPKYYYEENLGIDMCEICKSATTDCIHSKKYQD